MLPSLSVYAQMVYDKPGGNLKLFSDKSSFQPHRSNLESNASETSINYRGHHLIRDALRTGKSTAVLDALRHLVISGENIDSRTLEVSVYFCIRHSHWSVGLEAFDCFLRLKAVEGHLPPLSTFKLIIRTLLNAKQLEKAVYLLYIALGYETQTSLKSKLVADEYLCSLVIDFCANSGRMDIAEAVISTMVLQNIKLGNVSFCIMIKGYGRQRRLSMISAILETMQAQKVLPDVVTLNALIDAYARCGNLSRAQGVVKAMESSFGGSVTGAVSPNTRTYNTLIKWLGKEGRLDEAFDVLESMEKYGCVPNEVSANSLVEACVRCGELDRAYQLLATTSSGVLGKFSKKHDKPAVEAFTSVLAGFAEKGDKRGAFSVFKAMSNAGVEPNLITYTSLINACMKSGAIEDARKLLFALESKGKIDMNFKPNVITYNAFLTGLCRAEQDVVEDELEDTAEGQVEDKSSQKGSGSTDKSSSTKSSLPGHIQEALELLVHMRHLNVAPSETTVNIVLDSIISLNPPRIQEALAVKQLMLKWNLIPNSITYSILIKGYSKIGNFKLATELFDNMLSDNRVYPDVIVLNTYLDACVRCGEMSAALSILARASSNFNDQKKSKYPNNFENDTFIQSANTTLSNSKFFKSGKKNSVELKNFGNLLICPNTISYSTVVLGLAQGINLFSGRKAMALYYEMRGYNLMPDEILVDRLLQICCNSRARKGVLTPQDGLKVLSDLKTLGWDADSIAKREKVLKSMVPALSEVWKENEKDDDSDSNTNASKRIFDKYGWNSMDSNFKII